MRLSPVLLLLLLFALPLHGAEVAATPPAAKPAAVEPVPEGTVHMLTRSIWPVKPGMVDCYVYLWTDKGPLKFEQMKQTLGARLHLVLVSGDHKYFYHAYPIATGEEGQFRYTINVTEAVPLRAFAIFTTDKGQKMVAADLNGETPMPVSLKPPQIIQAETDTMVFTIHFPSQLRVGKTSTGTLYGSLKSSKAPLKELEALKGYFAYFLAIDSDFKTLSPIEVIDPKVDENAYGGPQVRFKFTPAKVGFTKVIAQVRARGEDLLLPFTLRISPAFDPARRAPDEEDPDQIPLPPPDARDP